MRLSDAMKKELLWCNEILKPNPDGTPSMMKVLVPAKPNTHHGRTHRALVERGLMKDLTTRADGLRASVLTKEGLKMVAKLQKSQPEFKVGDRVCLALAHAQKGEVLKVKCGMVLLRWNNDWCNEWVYPDTIEPQ